MSKLEELIAKDADYTKKLNEEILPFMKENLKEGYFLALDGAKLHYNYIKNKDELATIVMCHGYCEFTRKYLETMYIFYNMGYSVFIMDHRGHGLSAREVDSLSKVHISSFQQYVKDFNVFMEDVVKEINPGKDYYLFAHSMGGAIGALYIEQYPYVFKKAVLSSPMLEMSTAPMPKPIVKLLCMLSYLPFFATKYVPGQHDYDHKYKYPECSEMSEARYKFLYKNREENPHYQSNGASFCWSREAINVSKKIIKNANLVKIPAILFQASEDTLVNPGAQNEFARECSMVELVRVEGSKHEIFNATDEIILNYYKRVMEFFSK